MAIVNDKRPVNLDLTTIKFPVPAIASIIHRISGIGLFLALPIVLWMLDRSLASPESFVDLQEQLSAPLARFVVWSIVSMFIYHLVAGIKHLLMDLGIGETLQGGRNGAFIALAVSAVLIAIAGVWIW